MLEEAADDADHADPVADALDTGPQAADAAHDEVDLDPGLRRAVQRLDRLGVDNAFIFAVIRPAAAGARELRFAVDRARSRGCACVAGATSSLRYRRCREYPVSELNEIADVGADRRAAREEAEVRVDARGLGVVVAGTDVHVAADAVGLAPDDERDLGVRLESRQPVGDVHAGIFQRARPGDVVALVAARLELDEHRDLLAALRGVDQRAHDRGVAGCPVQRELDREDVGVVAAACSRKCSTVP